MRKLKERPTKLCTNTRNRKTRTIERNKNKKQLTGKKVKRNEHRRARNGGSIVRYNIVVDVPQPVLVKSAMQSNVTKSLATTTILLEFV